MDPRQFKSKEELDYAYIVAWGAAQGAQQVLDQVQIWISDAEQLTRKEKGELKDKLREAFS